jgi:hypothetical protein
VAENLPVNSKTGSLWEKNDFGTRSVESSIGGPPLAVYRRVKILDWGLINQSGMTLPEYEFE